MDTFLWILLSTISVSLLAFVGILTLFFKEKLIDKVLLMLVALSAGALMGGAFLHLIPKAVESYQSYDVYLYILVGFSMFFLIEKIFHWRHCHKGKCDVHSFAYMNLFGDSVHNFIDGLIIAASFAVNVPLGISTVLAIALHEIPQEIGDFGVLVYGGFDKVKALALNFVVASMIILGGLVGYFFVSGEAFVAFLLPFAAGGFIYIGASDLIPQIRKETDLKKSLPIFAVFVLGIILMWGTKMIGF
ncbi:MAG: ZIP family metal transporter [Candidatus Aenigmarchaeota archaeon]|nr:ZIP family metal transporter [Candidatus Aenigmarchaeota archaeon]